MEAFFIYLLKSAGILSLFVTFYYLLLRKETFFSLHRIYLTTGLLLSIGVPFITLTNIILVNPITITQETFETSALAFTDLEPSFHWLSLLFYTYGIGALLFFIRLCLQLFSLRKLIRTSSIVEKEGFKYVETDKSGSPFSFFNYIIYNPSDYTTAELAAILTHEKIHVSQYHSIDILLSHLFLIFQWFNPFMWWYKKYVGQNLEFIADTNSIKENNKSDYQYLMLKASIARNHYAIVNPFFNSLIKKRIVMLNKSKSRKRNLLKLTLILPALAFFLVSFNTKTVYITTDESKTSTSAVVSTTEPITIVINKDTSDEELKEIKVDLAEKSIDFSYTVVHNSKNEIINIAIDFAAKGANGERTNSSSTFNNRDEPISPIHIVYDQENNSISMVNNKNSAVNLHKDSDHSIWVHSDNHDGHHKTIEIIDKNGKESIKVNGKEMSRADFDAMKKEDGMQQRHIKIKKSKGGSASNVFIWKDSDEDTEIHIDSDDDDEQQLIFINGDGKDSPLIIIDGKEAKKEAMKKLNADDIASIHVYKVEKAMKKYGKKGKDGVIEIKTKKN